MKLSLGTLLFIACFSVEAATITTGNVWAPGRPTSGWGFGYTNDNNTNHQAAQSITTSIGGYLESIEVSIADTGDAIDDLTLGIYTASGDIPDLLLGSVTEPKANLTSESATIDFSGLGIFLAPSTKYVITASVTTPLLTKSQYIWSSTTDSGYADGVASFNRGGAGDPWEPIFSHHDLLFAVYVNPVPIPPALWLFGSALGLLGWMRRKAT